MHFKVSATSAENTDTLPNNVGVRSKEGHRNPNARRAVKDCMDSVGHEVTHQQQENHRKEDGKVLEKVTVKEHRKGGKSKGGKGGKQWKGKGKGKERSTYPRTQPPEEQWSNGSGEQWPEQPWQTEANNVSWGEKQMSGLDTQQS